MSVDGDFQVDHRTAVGHVDADETEATGLVVDGQHPTLRDADGVGAGGRAGDRVVNTPQAGSRSSVTTDRSARSAHQTTTRSPSNPSSPSR